MKNEGKILFSPIFDFDLKLGSNPGLRAKNQREIYKIEVIKPPNPLHGNVDFYNYQINGKINRIKTGQVGC